MQAGSLVTINGEGEAELETEEKAEQETEAEAAGETVVELVLETVMDAVHETELEAAAAAVGEPEAELDASAEGDGVLDCATLLEAANVCDADSNGETLAIPCEAVLSRSAIRGVGNDAQAIAPLFAFT